jgi:hypothetical protein
MRTRLMAISMVLALLVTACATAETNDTASGGVSGTTLASQEPASSTTNADEGVDMTDDEEIPDQCTLLTDEEVSTLAGHELVAAGGDSFLGCAYAPPDEIVGDVVVNAGYGDGDAQAVAAEGWPNAAQVIPVDVGDDTVAVTSPEDDGVVSVITASDGRFVQLVVTFLFIEPTDTEQIEAAAQLAVTALDRWESG